jgi:hypothetical protein
MRAPQRRRAVFDKRRGSIRGKARFLKPAAYILRRGAPHKDNKRSPARRKGFEDFPRRAAAALEPPGKNMYQAAIVSMGKRNPRVFGNSQSGAYAGNNFAGYARLRQKKRLFSAAAEKKRIAPFQAHNVFPGAGLLTQNAVYLIPRGGMAARGFSHGNKAGARRNAEKNLFGYKAVVDNHIGRLKNSLSPQRQKPRIARARAHKPDLPWLLPARARRAPPPRGTRIHGGL